MDYISFHSLLCNGLKHLNEKLNWKIILFIFTEIKKMSSDYFLLISLLVLSVAMDKIEDHGSTIASLISTTVMQQFI